MNREDKCHTQHSKTNVQGVSRLDSVQMHEPSIWCMSKSKVHRPDPRSMGETKVKG